MRILAIEPYFGGSHRHFLEGLAEHSHHEITILSLPARYWKWRMHGGAVTLAQEAMGLDCEYDLIFASEMLNLPNFLAMARRRYAQTPVVLYFHENQATYPMPPYEKRDLTYAYINWASIAAADEVWFNSDYHLDEFFGELPRLLKHFPDYQNLDSIAAAREKTAVVEPGCRLSALDEHEAVKAELPRIVWNHRWEYDKNPPAFFGVLSELKWSGARFELVLAGQNFRKQPGEFLEAQAAFENELVHFGYAQTFGEYARLLWGSHIMVSTATHEFFGISSVEAMYCRCHPLLPDRLNYPALASGEFLYSDDADLLERLQSLVADPGRLRGEDARDQVARFDWSVRAPEFDAAFELAAGG